MERVIWTNDWFAVLVFDAVFLQVACVIFPVYTNVWKKQWAAVTGLRPDLTICVSTLMDSPLPKGPDLSYQYSADFARALRAHAANIAY